MFRHAPLWATFLLLLAGNAGLWASVRGAQARWTNVPPVAPEAGAAAFALGDRALAYRAIGLMLQNMGDSGGRVTNLRQYDYDRLVQWFELEDRLDPRSDFMPILASYYFGAVDDPQKLAPLVAYLRRVGNEPGNRRWRWLAQGVHLARYGLNDLDLAYAMALELAALPGDMPAWTRQMPAFIMTARGDKEAAYAIILEILKSDARKMDPVEIRFMKNYMCKRLLTPEQAAQNDLCIPEQH